MKFSEAAAANSAIHMILQRSSIKLRMVAKVVLPTSLRMMKGVCSEGFSEEPSDGLSARLDQLSTNH